MTTEETTQQLPKPTKPAEIALAVLAVLLLIGVGFLIGFGINNASTNLSALPAPELSEGQRGELGIDKNINESNIDDYLGRSDSVYYDMRLLVDPAKYENIGGDSYLSGFVDGFQVVSYPYLANVTGLPEAVGSSYVGPTLFTNNNGTYTPNYVESEQILNDLFPKDKYIFLMCGGGGYAGMTKSMLVALGWDASKIYVVGGYWYYEGNNNVEIKTTNAKGETVYAFWKIPYHAIDFNDLHKL